MEYNSVNWGTYALLLQIGYTVLKKNLGFNQTIIYFLLFQFFFNFIDIDFMYIFVCLCIKFYINLITHKGPFLFQILSMVNVYYKKKISNIT